MKDTGFGALFAFSLDGYWIWSVVFDTKIWIHMEKAFFLGFFFIARRGGYLGDVLG